MCARTRIHTGELVACNVDGVRGKRCMHKAAVNKAENIIVIGRYVLIIHIFQVETDENPGQ